MTKIEFLQSLAKVWFGNSQQHSIIEEIGMENYLIEQLGD